jgi:hypothetical protein
MRYFAEDELSRLLMARGLSLVSVTPFPDLRGQPSASTWNVLAMARG